jgi:hypothetical protein
MYVYVRQRCSRLDHLSKYLEENIPVFETRYATRGVMIFLQH